MSFNTHAFFKQFLYDPQNPLLFNNGFFVLFFAVFISLYYAFRNNFTIRRYITCFFSLYFFYKASGFFVVMVILSAIADFILSNAIYRQQRPGIRKILLIISIIFNLGVLCYFKYTNFFLSVSNDLFHTGFNPLNILLPIGISFYTFENLSYTIDVYRGDFVPAKKFSDYLLFLSFFPKLVMGPILRASDFVPQINKPYYVSEEDFAKGFYLIMSGMFKKLIISDYLTLNFVNYIFDDPSKYTGLENLFAVYAYAAVIYCDFSGYSDVAIGIAKWLGFQISPNFLSPYQSKNISEFWRRWHISLSSWLRDYVYIPLGGNRKSSFATWFFSIFFFGGIYFCGIYLFHFSDFQSYVLCTGIILLFIIRALIKGTWNKLSTNLNLLVTMLLGGLWHGASWNFILWGSMHGIALVVHKAWRKISARNLSKLNNQYWYNAIAVIITFHFVCFCWIFFKAHDFATALAMINQICNDFSFNVWNAFYENYKSVLWMIFLAGLLHAIPDSAADYLLHRFPKIPVLVYILLFFGFLVLYGIFKSAEQVLPIYLQF